MIQTIRESKGISRTQLAHLAGLPYPSLAAYESGRRVPSLPAGLRIADALDVHPRLLMEKRNEKNGEQSDEDTTKLHIDSQSA